MTNYKPLTLSAASLNTSATASRSMRFGGPNACQDLPNELRSRWLRVKLRAFAIKPRKQVRLQADQDARTQARCRPTTFFCDIVFVLICHDF